MKKVLIATTALVASAGFAAADVTISGYGRTAIDYVEDRGEGVNDTQIETRVRMNIDASASSDAGVDFGARVRLQYDDGQSNSTLSPAYLYVSASGLKVYVGNVPTAFDSAGLLYESEVGLISRSFGNPSGPFYAFSTSGYGGGINETCLLEGNAVADCVDFSSRNRMGVAAEYSVGDFTGRLSYVDPDQTASSLGLGRDEEISVSVDYKWNQIHLSAAAVQSGGGIDGADQYFLGAYYTIAGTDNGIGLNWIDNGSWTSKTDGTEYDFGKTIVLYGDYVVAPMTTISAYVANNDAEGNETDTAYGLGAKYDLGGAYLAGSIERGYDKNMRADMGVRFDF